MKTFKYNSKAFDTTSIPHWQAEAMIKQAKKESKQNRKQHNMKRIQWDVE